MLISNKSMLLASAQIIKDHVHDFLRQTGPSLSPFNAWVMLKGLETLPIRVAAQCASSAKIADYLAGQKRVAKVLYCGRADHPQAALVQQQMSGGGQVVTFVLDGGKREAFGFLNALEIARISNNLGDAKSLVTHPATTTHFRLKPEERAELGIGDGMIRLSVGLEDAEDLIGDMERGLKAAFG